MTQTELISDGQLFNGAKSGNYDIRTYDDGFGPLWISRSSMGIVGIVRAQSFEDAYSICEDEFFPEADETIEQIVKEYGFKREHVKIARDANTGADREVVTADYSNNGRLSKNLEFVRWETRQTPDPDGWMENELFQEGFGFRPNGPNKHDKLNHGIYSKDLNGDALDRLTPELLADLGITLDIQEWEGN